MMLTTRKPVPALKVDTTQHGAFDLANDSPEQFSLVVFYRGLHCPICARYLTDLEQLTPKFAERGTTTIAISSDTHDRAVSFGERIKASSLRIGYGLALTAAKDWDLAISTGRGKTSIGVGEPDLFSEPGLFLVRSDGTLFWRQVQSMPFARPQFADMLSNLDFIIKNDYPARGEYDGAV